MSALSWGYQAECSIYSLALIAGVVACVLSWRNLRRSKKNLHRNYLYYKMSLTVADCIVLFVYAPTQLAWIYVYWWHGGDLLCRGYKFVATFALHLTGNMQVLIAVQRLLAMSRMHRLARRTQSGVWMHVSAAWLLALLFALPQLYVFRVERVTDEREPQCVSIWMIDRYKFEQRLEADERFRALQSHNASVAAKLMAQVATKSERELLGDVVQQYATIYNALHLATMVVIPHILELSCYVLILLILRRAQRGEFVTPSRKIGTAIHSWKLMGNRGTLRRCDDATKFGVRKCLTLDVLTNATLPFAATAPLPMESESVISSTTTIILPKSRSLVEAAPKRKYGAINCPAPWVQTISVAKRKTRNTTLLMLTFNVLFWLPYCIYSVISSLTISDSFEQFHFACALITLNAASNILLY